MTAANSFSSPWWLLRNSTKVRSDGMTEVPRKVISPCMAPRLNCSTSVAALSRMLSPILSAAPPTSPRAPVALLGSIENKAFCMSSALVPNSATANWARCAGSFTWRSPSKIWSRAFFASGPPEENAFCMSLPDNPIFLKASSTFSPPP